MGLRVLLVDEGFDHGGEGIAEEDGDDRGGRLVGAEAVVIAGRGDGHAEKVGVRVDGRDQAGENDEELQVVLGIVARLEEVLAVGAEGPVVVLAGAVDVLERLLVLQADETMVRGDELHLLHGEEVVVDGERAHLEDGGELVLARGDLVVLGLGGDAELPELVVELLHELVDRRTDGAEVVLLKLLALGGLAAEERAPGEDEVGTSLEVLLLDEEVLLLGADGGVDAVRVHAEESEHALGLLLEGDLGTEQRRLLVERLAGVRDEGGGDAEDLVLDERGAHGVPHGVAAGLEGGTKSAGGEARRVGLALDELLAREGHEHGAVVARSDETVVLLGGDAGQGLEPVREVRRTVLECPFLHRVRDFVGDVEVERLAVLDHVHELLVGGLG